MNCKAGKCNKLPEWRCSIHNFDFCVLHYQNHCLTCENQPISINYLEKVMISHIKNLNQKYFQFKLKIVGLGHQFMLDINHKVKNLIDTLEVQRSILLDTVKISKDENEIIELLNIIPIDIRQEQQNFNGLFELQKELLFEEFYSKVERVKIKTEKQRNNQSSSFTVRNQEPIINKSLTIEVMETKLNSKKMSEPEPLSKLHNDIKAKIINSMDKNLLWNCNCGEINEFTTNVCTKCYALRIKFLYD